MPDILEPQYQLYASLMNEARIRIFAVRDALAARNQWAPRILREFCYLQYRLLCELVAIGCLIAHGDIQNRRTLGNWKIPEILKRLEEINPEFYPRGVRIAITADDFRVDEYDVPQLSRAELKNLWEKSGNFLHKGNAIKVMKDINSEPETGPVVDVDELYFWAKKIVNLLDNHVISSADKTKHLVVALLHAETGQSSVWLAVSPSQDAS